MKYKSFFSMKSNIEHATCLVLITTEESHGPTLCKSKLRYPLFLVSLLLLLFPAPHFYFFLTPLMQLFTFLRYKETSKQEYIFDCKTITFPLHIPSVLQKGL